MGVLCNARLACILFMTYKKSIDATHPMSPADDGQQKTNDAAHMLAMKLVGERHAKADLVDLVRWLITRSPEGLIG